MSTKINKVGLEFEYLLRKDGELVFPEDYGLSTDDYCIIGEVRSDPGETVEEVIANFYKSLTKIQRTIKKKGLSMDLVGHAIIPMSLHAETMKKMGTKVIADTKNIYGVELLEMSDVVIKKGNQVGRYISTGLHLHFSSDVTVTRNITKSNTEYVYSPFNLPLQIEGSPVTLNLFTRATSTCPIEEEVEVIVSTSRLNRVVRDYFIKQCDDKLLPKFKNNIPLKYREPGFYEIKPWGFEYRSLPFNKETLNNIVMIVETAFGLLEELDL